MAYRTVGSYVRSPQADPGYTSRFSELEENEAMERLSEILDLLKFEVLVNGGVRS